MGALAAALLALLMLTYASATSNVMQVEMALSSGMGPQRAVGPARPPTSTMTMAGMVMERTAVAGPTHSSPPTNDRHRAACAFCAAAAHAPLLRSVAPLRSSVAFAFAAFHLVSSHGPRGPPALQPRARGPPSDPALL